MHPLALTSYPRGVAVTRSRSSRRRARRAAIAVVVGLLGAGAGSGQALADPPQNQFRQHQHLPGSHANIHQLPDWSTVAPPSALRDRHDALGQIQAPVTGGRTVPVNSPAGDGSFDAWPAAALAALFAGLLGVVAITRRRRLPTAT
jgi:hypothetical protein